MASTSRDHFIPLRQLCGAYFLAPKSSTSASARAAERGIRETGGFTRVRLHSAASGVRNALCRGRLRAALELLPLRSNISFTCGTIHAAQKVAHADVAAPVGPLEGGLPAAPAVGSGSQAGGFHRMASFVLKL